MRNRKILAAALAVMLGVTMSLPGSVTAAELQKVNEVSLKGAQENFNAVQAAYGVQEVYSVQGKGNVTAEVTGYLENCKGRTSPVMIYFPSGNYTLGDNNNLVLHSNVYIVAENDTTIQKSGGSNSMFRTRAEEGVKNILVYGGTWDASKKGKNILEFNSVTNGKIAALTAKGTKADVNGIQIANSKDIDIENVTLSQNGRHGIQITSKSTAAVTQVTATNNSGVGIAIDTGATVTISESTANSNNENGIATSESKVTIKDSQINGNKESGLSIANKSVTQVTGTTMNGNSEYGITISKASTLNQSVTGAQNNTIRDNNWSGVSASNAGTFAHLEGNSIVGNGKKPKKTSSGEVGHGIGVSERASAEIVNNTLTNNSECGVSVFDSGKATIIGNTISANSRHGIGARKKAKLTVKNNTIEKNKYNGILAADETNAVIEDTVINETGEMGLSVVDKSTVTISGSTVSNSKESNISISKGSDKKPGASVTLTGNNTVSGSKKAHGIVIGENSKGKLSITGRNNTIQNNRRNGINVSGKGSTATLKNATVKKNKAEGIMVNQQATVSEISNCKVADNGDQGICVKAKSTVKKMQKNTVTGHKKYGMVFYDSTVNGVKNNVLSNPKAKNEIYKKGTRSNASQLDVVIINKLKSSSKTVQGKAQKNCSITVQADKKYTGKSNKNGKYSIKIAKQKKGTEVKVTVKDKEGNQAYNVITVN